MIKEFSVVVGIAIMAGIMPSALLGITSASAFDLGKPGCGGEYGGLSILFSRNMKKFSDIDARIKNISWIKKKYLVLGGGDYPSTSTSVYNELKDAWQREPNKNGLDTGDFSVPIGSEEYIAEALYKTGIAKSISHAAGICGGAEVIYALVKRSSVGAIENPVNFEAFAEAAVLSFVAKAGASYSFTEGPLAIPPMEPFRATKRFTIAVPSVVSRGPQWNSTWDKYDLVLGLLAPRGSDYVVVVHTEGLRTAPKLNGRTKPPSNEHFRGTNSGDSLTDYQAEFVAAASFGQFLAGDSRRCRVDVEGIDAEMLKPFSCRMPSIHQ